jgi:hypothetical protein
MGQHFLLVDHLLFLELYEIDHLYFQMSKLQVSYLETYPLEQLQDLILHL